MMVKRERFTVPMHRWTQSSTDAERNRIPRERIDLPPVLVEVVVDFEGLAKWLGAKAAKSKKQKAVEASGCVVVRVVK